MNIKEIIIRSLAIALLLAPCNAFTNHTGKSSIKVVVKGIKPVKGNVGILIFTAKDGFPGDERKAFKQSVIPVESNQVEQVYHDLPPGKYAVAIIHDANGNRKLDTNFMGIPKEGYGVSNNIVNMFGPPGFEESSFVLKSGVFTTEIKVQY